MIERPVHGLRRLMLGALLTGASHAPAQQATIAEIEVNQVLGRARALDGSVSPVNRFVAGKDTVVRSTSRPPSRQTPTAARRRYA